MNLKTSGSPLCVESSMRQSLDVGIIQFKGDRSAYLQSQERLLDAIKSAGEHGVKVLVCPECACSEYSFSSPQEALEFSESIDGEFAVSVAKLTRQFEFWCFIGVVERDQELRLFNSVFIFDPHGNLRLYRKRLLFDADHLWAESGDDYPIFLPPHLSLEASKRETLSEESPPYPLLNIFGWRATVGICMDLNDPRFIEFCECAEIELIAFPTNWIDQGHDVVPYWAHVLQDASRVTLLAANSYGQDGPYMLRGRSAILQANPPTLLGVAPSKGDYLITCQLEHPSIRQHNEREELL